MAVLTLLISSARTGEKREKATLIKSPLIIPVLSETSFRQKHRGGKFQGGFKDVWQHNILSINLLKNARKPLWISPMSQLIQHPVFSFMANQLPVENPQATHTNNSYHLLID